MKKKQKINEILIDDSEDKFIIYQMFSPTTYKKVDRSFKPSKVASPYFGSNVVDRNSFIDNAGTIDVDYGYDYARLDKDKHISDEELIKKHGSKYYEFEILDNKKIIEYAGGDLNEDYKKENNTSQANERKKEIKNSFVVTADELLDEPDDLGIKVPNDFDVNYENEDASFNIKINDDNYDEFEYNSYSSSMAKPNNVNIPSFLNHNTTEELKFDDIELNEEINIDEENETIEIEKEIVEEYHNPAVDKNISIEEAIRRANENYNNVSNNKVEDSKIFDKENKYDDYNIPYKSLFPTSDNVRDDHPIWLEDKKQTINDTFKAFGIDGEVINYTKGPAFTLYEIMLAPGVNVKKVNQIYENLQMNLQAKSIRIQSPIPGRNTVGIEAPNDIAEVVKFGDILSDEYVKDNKSLNVALGKNIDGTPVYQDITDMPHCLIAGATQSGKSVSINTILVSLLIKNSPDELKLILVDPKKVELAFYESLPHLATPVIDDPVEATEALKWACAEMDRRYDVLARNRVRKISDYNKKRKDNPSMEAMPFIVIVVDEFNDLVMQCGNEVNECIVRLAQKARACGMHVILATQRPTVDVVSGTIKANVPCRIAFRVASAVDSQTILDEIGAESLLGRGDMLIKNGGNPLRAQGAYISDDEIANICDYICERYEPDYLFTHEDLRKSINKSTGANSNKEVINESEELLYEIACYCVESNSCSINSIQNQFNLGFNRASRIVALFEERKIVSPKCGTKSREILVDSYKLREIFGVDD
ncbi:MAG: DNA translocase FtsK [Anaeroplasma sp.]